MTNYDPDADPTSDRYVAIMLIPQVRQFENRTRYRVHMQVRFFAVYLEPDECHGIPYSDEFAAVGPTVWGHPLVMN